MTVGTAFVSRAPDRLTQEFSKADRGAAHLRRHRAQRLQRHVCRRVHRSREARRAGVRAVHVGRNRARRRRSADVHAAQYARSRRAGRRPVGRHAATRPIAEAADGSGCARSWRSNYNPPAEAATNGRSGMALRIRICARTAVAGTNPSIKFCLLHLTRLDHELDGAVAIDHGSTRTVEIRRLIQQLAVTELARSIAHGDRPARHAEALGP